MSFAATFLGLALGFSGGEEDLARALQPGPGKGRGDSLQALVGLGIEGLPQLFSLVTGAGLEPLLADGETRLVLPLDQLDELGLEAMERLPSKRVLDFLHGAGGSGATLQERIAVVRALGALESSQGIALLVRQVEALGPAAGAGAAGRHLAPALGAILLEDPHGFRTFEKALEDTDDATRGLLLRAIGSLPDGRAADLLLDQLGSDPRLDATLVEQYGRLASNYPWVLRRDPLDPLVTLSTSKDASLRLEAVRGLQRLPGPRSARALIERLGDARARVGRTAEKALAEHFGVRGELSKEAWEALLEKEETWWREEAPAHLERLTADAPAQFTASLRVLMRHPLHREEIALHLTDVLPELDDVLVPGLTTILIRLGSKTPVPELAARLRSSDPEVRRACHAALRELTGWKLPPEPLIWQRSLRGR